MNKKLTVGIIGYGRFGKLWASCLLAHASVRVYDKKKLPKKLPRGVAAATLARVVHTDILFLSVPISEIESCCKRIAPLLKSHTIVSDVLSVKIHPVSIMNIFLPKNQPLIATHPLFGPDSAQHGIAGKSIVVCPLRMSMYQRNIFENLIKSLGLTIIRATPRQHDKAMARSQALVHLIGRSVQPLRLRPQNIFTPEYASLLTMQRMVQHDSFALFFDMQRYNPYAKTMRKKLIGKLTVLERKIDCLPTTHFVNPHP